MLHPALDGSIVHVKPLGSVSVKLTPVALPAPMLLSVTSKPMSSPAETGPAGLATLVTFTSGQFTVTEAVALLFVFALAASLLAEAEAVFETVPQLADEVVAFTCTVVLKPAARVVGV